jgi:hypothetical protein
MVPVTNRPRYELERIADALNGKLQWEQVNGPDEDLAQKRRFKQTPPLLRGLVQAWQSSGPDFFRFSCDHRKMWEDVERYWVTGRRLNPLLLVGAPGGGVGIGQNNRPEPDPYEEALRLFLLLLFNPECDRLAGPCARCSNYYIPRRRSTRNKVYCSRSCGTRATALAATRKRRDEDHADKLWRAAEGAREWTTDRTKKEWKPWVSGRHPDITVKFLTRAVNNGELKPPTKGKKS